MRPILLLAAAAIALVPMRRVRGLSPPRAVIRHPPHLIARAVTPSGPTPPATLVGSWESLTTFGKGELALTEINFEATSFTGKVSYEDGNSEDLRGEYRYNALEREVKFFVYGFMSVLSEQTLKCNGATEDALRDCTVKTAEDARRALPFVGASGSSSQSTITFRRVPRSA
jgi:hypothetical protein